MARGGPRAFSRWLDRQIDEEIPNWQVDLHLKLHEDVMLDLLKNSPVGDPDQWQAQSLPAPKGYVGGRFRGNWQTATPSDSSRGEVAGAERRSAAEVAGGNRSDAKKVRPYSRIWLVNNVPYSIRLSEGWSKQAPDGWVDDVIDRQAAGFGRF